MPRKWARKCERYCWLGVAYFPLVFVYSITTWGVWVESTIGFLPGSADSAWIGMSSLAASLHPELTKARDRNLTPWNHPLPPLELVLHRSGIHESGDDYNGEPWL